MKVHGVPRIIGFSLALNVAAITIATQVPERVHQSYQDVVDDDALRVRQLAPWAVTTSIMNITSSVVTVGTGTLCAESIDEFPSFFTDEQRKQGAILIPCIIAVYCFTVIAIICDNYFLPCVERICEELHLSQDVAAATFMAIATSAPELFSNIIGTFITKSDIGIGTVVGSSMFNTLGVASIGGLAATSPIQLDWWPLTRDCAIYICSIVLLVWITWDGHVFWYEALVLFIIYFVYLTVMFQSVRISGCLKRFMTRLFKRKVSEEPTKSNKELCSVTTIDDEVIKYIEHKENQKDKYKAKEMKKEQRKFETNGLTTITITSAKQPSNGPDASNPNNEEENDGSIFKFPRARHWTAQVFFVYTWPIKFVMFCTVPDPKRHPRVFPITFLMCVIWIALNSYIVSWMVTIIGSTFGIQDSVLGLTFLAAGGCLPEAISITITSRKGEGRMGISNALGANTMNILLSLGLPWFIKTLILVAEEGSTEAYITIRSGSLEYTILALILVATTLYVCLSWNKFRLSRKSGAILICFYAFFLVSAILSEMYLFQVPCNPLLS